MDAANLLMEMPPTSSGIQKVEKSNSKLLRMGYRPLWAGVHQKLSIQPPHPGAIHHCLDDYLQIQTGQ